MGMFKSDLDSIFDKRKRLVAKYGEMLEGIQDEYTKQVTAQLLENQSDWLNSLDEATRLTSVGSFDRYVYPLVRRTYPTLIVNDIVSVQPMSGPQGLIFYLKFKYSTAKGAISANSEYLGDNVSGFDETYSSAVVKNEVYATQTGSGATLTHTMAYLPVVAGTATVTAVVGGVTKTATDTGSGTFTGTGVTSGTIDYATGACSIVWSTAPDNPSTLYTTYTYNNEANTLIPEMDMDISKTSVTAKSRKLRAKWSPEAAQDLRNLHGLDAEVELVTILSQQIALEINHEVVMNLYNNAYSTGSWSATPGAGVSYREHKDTLIDTLISMSNDIYKNTLRGQANFVVCSTEVSSVIESLPGFIPASNNPVMGIGFIGTLNSRWNIYKDPFITSNKAVIGYKGDSFLDTGYVHSPYIPLQTTPTIQTADDFISRKGLLSRYAGQMINSKFYGVLTKS